MHTYVITFKANGHYEMSAPCTGLSAARRWHKWYSAQAFASKVRIMFGGPGGIEISARTGKPV